MIPERKRKSGKKKRGIYKDNEMNAVLVKGMLGKWQYKGINSLAVKITFELLRSTWQDRQHVDRTFKVGPFKWDRKRERENEA